jgi:hypothetical protein
MRSVALPRSLAALALTLALGAPFGLVAGAGRALVKPLSQASVDLLLRWSAPLVALPEAAPAPAEPEAAPNALAEPVAVKPVARQPHTLVKRPLAALFVAQSTVLRLAQTSARPRGSFVGPRADRPAGLLLSGVAGLGIGLQDGDILVEALGFSPRSAAQVVGAIVEARARRAAALSGTLWRRGQTFRITVEQPY